MLEYLNYLGIAALEVCVEPEGRKRKSVGDLEECGYFPPEKWNLPSYSWVLLGVHLTVSFLAAGLFGSQILLDHFQSCYCKYSHEPIWEAKRKQNPQPFCAVHDLWWRLTYFVR